MRTGDEPRNARSPLRMRLALTVVGMLGAAAGVVTFTALGSAALVVVFAAIGVVALVDAAVVLVRIRQGPHYQPGRTIPPYRPAEPPGGGAGPRRGRSRSLESRRRRYLALMGLCLTLFVLAWAWVRFYSTTAAVVMTVVAMTIPPFAAIVANAGSPMNRE